MEQKRRFSVSLLLIAVLPLCAHSFPFTEENPIAYGKVKIQSWKARRDFNIVKQDLDFSCGAASVQTLLNNFYGQELAEESDPNMIRQSRRCLSIREN